MWIQECNRESGRGSTQIIRRFSVTRAPSTRTQRKHIEVGDMSIEILTRNESVKYLGQKISFYQPETTEIKSRIREGCIDIPQIQTRVDIEKLHAQTPSTAFRRHRISDCLLRSRNVGTQQRTRKNDSIDGVMQGRRTAAQKTEARQLAAPLRQRRALRQRLHGCSEGMDLTLTM